MTIADETTSTTCRLLEAALSGDMYTERPVRIQAAAAMLLHEDMERLTDAIERVATAIESLRGM